MQARIWKIHPLNKLPPAISMWTAPTYPHQLVRFGPVLVSGDSVYNPQPTTALEQAVVPMSLDDDLDTQHNVDMIREGHLDPFEQHEIEKERQESSAQALEELLIPLQPRKASLTPGIKPKPGQVHEIYLEECPN